MRPLVFLDTETLGLGLSDPIWEVALIRREEEGDENAYRWFLTDDNDWPLVAPDDFPDPFRADFEARYGKAAAPLHPAMVAAALETVFRDRPRVIGAVPNFDTERIAHQLGVKGWHHRLRCVETLTAGALGREVGGLSECAAALGLPVTDAHTAMGDVLMVRAIWDALVTAYPTEKETR